MIYELSEIISFARENSPFYKELYLALPEKVELVDLPIVSQDHFWKANTWENNQLLTHDPSDGIVFKSGGTTGNPKFSVFTKEEWKQFTHDFGRGMDHSGLKKGDRVANLFYSGELYASFIFITKSLDFAETPVIQYPIAGATPLEEMIKIFREFNINVLCGVPTTFMNLASLLIEKGETISVDRILYGGESLFDDQRSMLEKAFPGALIQSVGYASVDGGQLGYVDTDCKALEHKVFDGTIMEIINEETGKVITEEGVIGKLVYTNLTRKLMPIIRYPVGDEAMWVGKNKFKLLGRSDEGARVGPVTVNRDDIANILHSSSVSDQFLNFQIIVDRFEQKDRLIIRVAMTKASTRDNLSGELTEHLLSERPMLYDGVKEQIIARPKIEIVDESELERNPRTGKLKLMIDQRF